MTQLATTDRGRGRTRRSTWRLAAAVTAAAAALSFGPAAIASATADTPPGRPAATGVQQSLDGLVAKDHYPGVLAAVRGRSGPVRSYTAGVANLDSRTPVPVDGEDRNASNTKMFTATVLLQLVGEKKIALDAPVDRYLPGLVRGPGIDGRRITVRQLLNHSSGLPDYDDAILGGDILGELHTYFEPRQLLDAALKGKALSAPGKAWSYSNTNYLLAGLIVQAVTGRPIGEEITTRIIDPLGLRHTYWPGQGEQTLRGPHPTGYVAPAPGKPLVDVTRLDPSFGWAAGALVSTPSELLTFMSALVSGRLLGPAELLQMKTSTVHAADWSASGAAEDGLGIARIPLSCGGYAWTHGGDIQGFESRDAVTEDGRGAVVVVTALPGDLPSSADVDRAVDTAVCH